MPQRLQLAALGLEPVHEQLHRGVDPARDGQVGPPRHALARTDGREVAALEGARRPGELEREVGAEAPHEQVELGR
jgi:hypothetical protein